MVFSSIFARFSFCLPPLRSFDETTRIVSLSLSSSRARASFFSFARCAAAVSVSTREFNLRRNGFHYRKNYCRPSRSRGDGTWTLSSGLQHGKSSSTCEQEEIVSRGKRVTASTVRLTGNGKGQIASAGKLEWSTKNRDNWNKET